MNEEKLAYSNYTAFEEGVLFEAQLSDTMIENLQKLTFDEQGSVLSDQLSLVANMVPFNILDVYCLEGGSKPLTYEKYSPLEVLGGYPIVNYGIQTPDKVMALVEE